MVYRIGIVCSSGNGCVMLSVSRQGGIRRYFVGKRGMGNHQSYIIVWVTLWRIYFFVCFLGGGRRFSTKSGVQQGFLQLLLLGIHSGILLGPGKRGHLDGRLWPRKEG